MEALLAKVVYLWNARCGLNELVAEPRQDKRTYDIRQESGRNDTRLVAGVRLTCGVPTHEAGGDVRAPESRR